ncbi:hypothetical protein CLV71_10588 [Actinophytocola oryzae]|uniref:Uncharacterized protein n=1 Tax=Actinophytocola oryzae TaxID=502181 RepID=A0A4R7VRG9_9PSEU|nr:hypothetical protein CLV71_10588 [Actinophytocola oryzae]
MTTFTLSLRLVGALVATREPATRTEATPKEQTR